MNITTANLGWLILACMLGGIILGGIQDWFTGQYEATFRMPFRFRVTRRWYGTSAHVCLRIAEDDEDPARYVVLDRDEENTAAPWLKVHKLNPEAFSYWDEDAEAFWAPVTDFAPYTVRLLRPHILRSERYRWPMLFDYLPLRQPAGYLGTDA